MMSDENNNRIQLASEVTVYSSDDEGVHDVDASALAAAANDLFIERMQNITVRKTANKQVAAAAARRKSVHQIGMTSNEKRESSYWNYDELNELKMKFLSLLSSAPQNETKLTASNNRFSMNSEPTSYSTQQHSPPQQQQKLISGEDYSKIESFYRSFGTQLHVTNNFASLYTLTLNDATDSKSTLESMINLFMLNDDHVIQKQQWTVCHRGVPLWLFNTGANPRRPYRQLKFTLAEKGTGFILWQDRIDVRSDFKIFRKRNITAPPATTTSQQKSSLYSLYQENLADAASQSTASNLILTFKASDRKTLVFIKFDIYQEILKFFSYYLKVHNRLCDEIRQRTKSLPVGIGNEVMLKYNSIKKMTITNPTNTTNKKKKPPPLPNDVSNICIVKYKRISKNDISLPSNIRHLINVKPNERCLYYTLSKLLPVDTNSKNLSNSVSQSLSSSLSTSSSINDTELDQQQHRYYSSPSENKCYNNKNKCSPTSSSSSSSSSNNYKLKIKTIK